MSKFSENDKFFMRRALALAGKGFGKVAPNPMVGAVLVKNGKIIAEGYHQRFGGSHAEVIALRNLTKVNITGAVLYVTLEPCCHQGKTPPCTNFLISGGIKDLVVAMRDPNPLVAGRGIKILKAAGVKVRVGVLKQEAIELNKVFIKNKTEELPFVSIKLGLTLDGKIAPLNTKSIFYITNQKSLKYVHRIRAEAGAILTTSETILKDNSHLGVRMVKGKDPLRVVVDSKLRTDPKAAVYRDNNVVVATTLASSLSRRKLFARNGIELLLYNKAQVPLKQLLQDLYKRGVYNLMTEAGAKFVTALLTDGLADELMLFFAPKILGQGIPWIDADGIKKLHKPLKLEQIRVERFDDDTMISGRIVH